MPMSSAEPPKAPMEKRALGGQRLAGDRLIELREVGDREFEVRVVRRIDEVDIARIAGKGAPKSGSVGGAFVLTIAWAT